MSTPSCACPLRPLRVTFGVFHRTFMTSATMSSNSSQDLGRGNSVVGGEGIAASFTIACRRRVLIAGRAFCTGQRETALCTKLPQLRPSVHASRFRSGTVRQLPYESDLVAPVVGSPWVARPSGTMVTDEGECERGHRLRLRRHPRGREHPGTQLHPGLPRHRQEGLLGRGEVRGEAPRR